MPLLGKAPLPETTVEYRVYPSPDTDFALDKLLDKCNAAVSKHVGSYLWHRDTFSLQTDKKEHCLWGKTDFGENVEDEWFVISLLKEISRDLGAQVIVRVWDSDGEVLLIEAADELPDWAQDPEVAEQRVFLFCGQVHLVPVAQSPAQLTCCPAATPMADVRAGVAAVCRFPQTTIAKDNVQKCIQQRLGSYPGDWSHQRQRFNVELPVKTAALLASSPQLASKAVRAVCEADARQVRACQKTPAGHGKMTTASVCLTKCLYAMLRSCQLLPYKRTGFELPPKSDERYLRCALGFRLWFGVELLSGASRAHEDQDVSRSAGFLKFKRHLEQVGFFQDFIPGSRDYVKLHEQATHYFIASGLNNSSSLGCEVDVSALKAESFSTVTTSRLEPEDPTDWLDLSKEDFDKMLEKHFKIRSEGKISERLDSFLHSESDMKGIELPEMDPIQFNVEGLESAFGKLLGSADECEEEDLDEMLEYYEVLESELKGSKIKEHFGEELDVESNTKRNLMSSVQSQQDAVGPALTLLRSLIRDE